MGVIFLIVFFFVSFLIVALVLLQEGKGGGLTGMSAGMDGVMGAKNPLRRMTAYLFVIFILMAISINVYFHNRTDNSLPAGAVLPEPVRTLQEDAPLSGTEVVSEGALRPDSAVDADPLRPSEAPAAPITPIRPENGESASESVKPAGSAAAESLQQVEARLDKAEEGNRETSDATSGLRPEAAGAESAVSLQPPSEATASSLAPPSSASAAESPVAPPKGEEQ